MSKADKVKERLYTLPKDFTWDELVTVLSGMGYQELKSTGSSARKFVDERNHVINLHKPHPGKILKMYAIKEVVTVLKEKDKEREEQKVKASQTKTGKRR